MTESTKTFSLNKFELLVLNSFFLSIPLPPMIIGEDSLSDEEAQTAIEGAVQSLVDKGCIVTGEEQGTMVLPELAQHLRDIAYGNQMLHLIIQHKAKESRQMAYYHHSGRFVAQEQCEAEQYEIHPAEDLGQTFIDGLLSEAPKGQRGSDTQIPLETWLDLLGSREAGIEDEVLAKIMTGDRGQEDRGTECRRKFIKEVLQAEKVIVLTAVTDRLQNEEEMVSLVITKSDNWLVFESQPAGEEVYVRALEVPRKNMLLGVESLFTELESAIAQTGSEA